MAGKDVRACLEAAPREVALPARHVRRVLFPIVIVVIGDRHIGARRRQGNCGKYACKVFDIEIAGRIAANLVDPGAIGRRGTAVADGAGREGDERNGPAGRPAKPGVAAAAEVGAAAGMGETAGIECCDGIEHAAGAEIVGVVVRGGAERDIRSGQRVDDRRIGGMQENALARGLARLRAADCRFEIG